MNVYQAYLEAIEQSRLETATGIYLENIAAIIGIDRKNKKGDLKSDSQLRRESQKKLEENKSP